MKLQSLLWRLLVRIERHLPVQAPPVLVNGALGPQQAATGRTRGRWAAFGAVLPMITLALVEFLRVRSEWARMWRVGRPMLLDFTLVAAAATLVAAVAFGVRAWRQAKADELA